MNTKFLKELYEKLPEFVKILSSRIIRRGMICNPVFLAQHKELVEADLKSEAELEAMQFKKLKETCIWAYENTKYYHRIFDESGFDCYGFESFDEFTQKVPLLTKDIVLENYDDINVQSVHGDYPSITGGSSGKRLVINNAQECFYRENAFLCHHYLKFGNYDFKRSKMAYIGGDGKTIVTASPLYNMMRYNSKLINKDTISVAVKSLNKYKPDFIKGLPSAVYFFCKLLREENIKLKFKVKGVILASENIYPHQRKFIESTFDCKSLTHYGHTERVIFAEEIFSDGDKPQYRFNRLYGFTELNFRGGVFNRYRIYQS